MVFVLMLVLFGSVKLSNAINVAPAPVRIHPIAVEAIDEGSEVDPIIPEAEEVAAPSSVSTPLWIILAGYCKEVQYSEWSECNYNFGTKGLMFRQIVRPTPGNCLPTVNQQVATVSSCDIIE